MRARSPFKHTTVEMSALLASSFVGRVAAFKATKVQVRFNDFDDFFVRLLLLLRVVVGGDVVRVVGTHIAGMDSIR